MNRADTQTVLEAVAGYDQREITGDMVSDWFYAIGYLDTAVALEAVAIHHKVNTWGITAKDVVALAEQIAQRPQTQRPMKRAVMLAYGVAGALNYDCPRCKAPAGETCTNPGTGQEAHAPCLTRLVGKAVTA